MTVWIPMTSAYTLPSQTSFSLTVLRTNINIFCCSWCVTAAPYCKIQNRHSRSCTSEYWCFGQSCHHSKLNMAPRILKNCDVLDCILRSLLCIEALSCCWADSSPRSNAKKGRDLLIGLSWICLKIWTGLLAIWEHPWACDKQLHSVQYFLKFQEKHLVQNLTSPARCHLLVLLPSQTVATSNYCHILQAGACLKVSLSSCFSVPATIFGFVDPLTNYFTGPS